MRDSSSGSGSPGGATEGGDEDENERITDDNNKQHGKRAGSTLGMNVRAFLLFAHFLLCFKRVPAVRRNARRTQRNRRTLLR